MPPELSEVVNALRDLMRASDAHFELHTPIREECDLCRARRRASEVLKEFRDV